MSGEVCYRRLADTAQVLANALRSHGVKLNGRVALHMTNLPELAVAYYACFKMGAIAAPLNIRLELPEIKPLLEQLKPAIYLGQASLYQEVSKIEPDVLALDARFVLGVTLGNGSRVQPWANLIGNAADPHSVQAPDLNAPAVLLTTSGTTGQSKFVAHTPATLSATADAFGYFGLDAKQIALHAVPMVHVSGLSTFLAYIQYGVQMILLEKLGPNAAFDSIELHRCSWVIGLPFLFPGLLEAQRDRPRNVRSLTKCLTAGDVCPPGVQQVFLDAFGACLLSFWASTESVGALTYGLQAGPETRLVPGSKACLVDSAGDTVSRGESGELLLQGPTVSPGYWTGPGLIEDGPQDGWLHTGDIMRQGDGNDFWFVSRKKELIVRGGSNRSPVEVEQVLKSHPGVKDAAVTGIPDHVLGQRVVGIVQLKSEADGNTLDEIRRTASEHLADYKIPERLGRLEKISKNPLGKTDRTAISALLSQEGKQ